MITVSAKFDSASLKSFVKGFEKRAENPAALLGPAGPWTRDVVKRRFPAGGPGWAKPLVRNGPPLYDTHGLQKSISYNISGNTLRVGTPDVRAAVLNGNHGPWYTMLPRLKKWLRIPNPDYFASDKQLREANPANIPGLFFVKSGSGGTASLCVSKPDKRFKIGSKLQIVFFLRKMVKIPARPFLYWTDSMLRTITMGMVDYVARGKWGARPEVWDFVRRSAGE